MVFFHQPTIAKSPQAYHPLTLKRPSKLLNWVFGMCETNFYHMNSMEVSKLIPSYVS